MAVMAAGVHLALVAGRVGQVGLFADRQGIHIGPQRDGPGVGAAIPAAADHADDAGAADAGHDLVAAEGPEPIRDQPRGAVHLVEHFRVLVDVASPRRRLGGNTARRSA